ncbi:hypothetical protein C1645_325302 [Glomus cerebriforme]|uniref:Uncharacterized protein n=1 Tax=Glomus cerebriforme TaxID=658196 RepID=A0A397SRQ9_9GLOM|nr:hypothetical protein C1645_325302 [Glomus cerebriforme]
MEILKWHTRITTLLWLIIPVFYTYFTIDELEPIPFFCPENYPYPSKNYYNICLIRTSNLIFMWLMFFVTLCFTIRNFIPENKIYDWFDNYDRKEHEEKEVKEEEKEEKKSQNESVA